MQSLASAPPAAAPAPHPPPAASRARPGWRGVNVLHLEDNRVDAELVRRLILTEWPESEITLVANRVAYTGELQLRPYDLILSDFTLEAFNGLEALELARRCVPATPFIFFSGSIGEDRALEAMQSGARDYVLKGQMKRFVAAVRRALQETEEQRMRHLAERHGREQAEILNQIREAIIITDLEDRITCWNAGAERLFGWLEFEALGQTAGQLFSKPGELEQFRSAQAATCGQGRWSGEMRLINRHGKPLSVEVRRTLLRDEAGRPKAHLSITSDITEQKLLREQLQRVQRLENIGLLAAGIAHDLNNMLAPMLMAAPLLRDSVKDPGGLRLLDILEKSAGRGAALVRQILNFAQGAGGEPQVVQVSHLLRDISMFMAETFPKTVQVEEHIEAAPWLIHANPSQIHQVLLNLCVNARDAMPQGGKLCLRVENCELDPMSASAIEGGRPGAFLVLQVEDTGTGIAPEVLARMWEPFVTTKGVGKGTGLGLSTVRGIITQHGGFIQLHTALGQGSTFRIYLPAVATGANPVRLDSPAAPRGIGELILIVDDEAAVRDLIATILTRHGYRVVTANDGAEATACFARHASEIRLVVSDLRMPHLDGAMLARVLKRMDQDVRLLAVSGLPSLGDKGQDFCPEEFAGAFLHKPFKAEDLLVKVSELLQRPAA